MELKNRRMDFTAVMGFVQTFLVSQEETNGRYVELEIVMKPGAGGLPCTFIRRETVDDSLAMYRLIFNIDSGHFLSGNIVN